MGERALGRWYETPGEGGARWRYVAVEATVEPSGFMVPRAVLWPDGRRFEVEAVRECRRWGQDPVWGYRIVVRGRETMLWHRHGAFFVQAGPDGVKSGSEPPEMDSYALRKAYGYRV